MDLQLNDELLSAFLDGEVSEEERLQIETQLANSPEWRHRYHQLVETVNAVRTLPEVTLPRDFSQGIMAQIAQRQQDETHDSANSEVTLATSSDRSVRQRRRQKNSPYASAWIAVAACLLIAAGLGIAYQAGLFGSGADPMIAQNDPVGNPGVKPIDHPATPDVKPAADNQPEEPKHSPFPTVDELANSQNNPPMEVVPMDDPGMERSPIGIRVNVRTKPGENPKPPSTMKRPGSLARSVFNLDPQEDPELDRLELTNFKSDDVTEEISAWADLNQDGEVSDSEAQQAWFRFMQTEGAVPALSEEALIAIDQDMNQKISIAEFHLAVASVRWNGNKAIRKAWYRLDANGDGVWSREDFPANARFATMGTPPLSQQLVQWHALLDRSRDGKVSRLEFALSADHIQLVLKTWEQKILNPQSYDQTKSLLNEYDRDGNGQLAGRELMRLQEKHQAFAPRMENVGRDGLSAYELYLIVEAENL
ncbi:EF hand [Bremerella volcania]|uniref:EF hand n=1 Tax=Bremerella volcania TaxID=2527984 RepID=A0A518CEG2_9BACT|nr:zf-HC2 domain-containing protein [Bremerella volcania]QDU77584.1 EF hand [Bremerella volcania]